MIQLLQDYRLIYQLGIKFLRIRYKNSILGFVWTLIQPVIYVLIFTLIFSNIVKDIDNYPVYALSGMLFWIFFNTTVSQILTSIIDNARLLKSMAIPSAYFPLGTLVAGVINLYLSLLPFFVLMFLLGSSFSFVNLLIIPISFFLGLFLFGFALALCSLNVFFRDVMFMWNALGPALFYVTPVAYTMDFVPEKYQLFLKLNPLYYFMEVIRDVLYFNQLPSINNILIIIGLTSLSLVFGAFVYSKLKRGFISNL